MPGTQQERPTGSAVAGSPLTAAHIAAPQMIAGAPGVYALET